MFWYIVGHDFSSDLPVASLAAHFRDECKDALLKDLAALGLCIGADSSVDNSLFVAKQMSRDPDDFPTCVALAEYLLRTVIGYRISCMRQGLYCFTPDTVDVFKSHYPCLNHNCDYIEIAADPVEFLCLILGFDCDEDQDCDYSHGYGLRDNDEDCGHDHLIGRAIGQVAAESDRVYDLLIDELGVGDFTQTFFHNETNDFERGYDGDLVNTLFHEELQKLSLVSVSAEKYLVAQGENLSEPYSRNNLTNEKVDIDEDSASELGIPSYFDPLEEECHVKLSQHQGELAVFNLKLKETAAIALGRHTGHLVFLQLEQLTDEAAESIVKHQGPITFEGLNRLSCHAAETLLTFPYSLHLDLRRLPEEASKILVRHPSFDGRDWRLVQLTCKACGGTENVYLDSYPRHEDMSAEQFLRKRGWTAGQKRKDLICFNCMASEDHAQRYDIPLPE